MREHVSRMRTRGLRYRHENRFLHFDRFLQQRPGADKEPLATLIREYAACASSAAGKVQRIQLGRVVATERKPNTPQMTAALAGREYEAVGPLAEQLGFKLRSITPWPEWWPRLPVLDSRITILVESLPPAASSP